MDKKWQIYVLRDPRDKQVRYVGKTSDVVWRELSHKGLYSTIGKSRIKWIKELQAAGREPEFEVIDECDDDEESSRVEFYWMMYYLSKGCRLTNGRMATGGTYAAKLTREHKQSVRQIAERRGMRETSVLWLMVEFATLHPFEDVLDGVLESLSLPTS